MTSAVGARFVSAARRWVLASIASIAASTVAQPLTAERAPPRSAHMTLKKQRGPLDTQDAGELLTLASLVNVHSAEVLALSDDEPTQHRFSTSLADRVTGSRIDLDPRLLELLRQIARRNPGARIELVSGFRSPKLNEMLRKKGHNVASRSQHSLGNACDFRIVGLTPKQMKSELLALRWEGGIGRYDKATDWFVHADVGRKRQWREGP